MKGLSDSATRTPPCRMRSSDASDASGVGYIAVEDERSGVASVPFADRPWLGNVAFRAREGGGVPPHAGIR